MPVLAGRLVMSSFKVGNQEMDLLNFKLCKNLQEVLHAHTQIREGMLSKVSMVNKKMLQQYSAKSSIESVLLHLQQVSSC